MSDQERMDTSPKAKRARISSQEDVPRPLLRQNSSRSSQLMDINPLPTKPSETGKVLVFGSGDVGQLGLGDEMLTRKRPMPLKELDDEEICDVVCGGLHTVAITKGGRLWSWGCNDQGAIGRKGDEYTPGPIESLHGINITKVACGDSVSMALSDSGDLYCWGTFRSAEGQLGFSKGQDVQFEPRIFEPLAKETIVDIAAGSDHCLALTNHGKVYSWGNGQQFQLGRRVIERRKKNGLEPEPLSLRNIKAIGTGSYHSFAISHTNDLYVWGLNNYEQCGLWSGEDGDRRTPTEVTTPTIVPALKGKGEIKTVVAGEHHSLVLMKSGEVYSFGRADSSQLGLPKELVDKLAFGDNEKSAFKRAVGLPTKIPGLENVDQIASGSNHAIVRTSDGTAYTWGFGESAALGNGTEEDCNEPCKLTGQKLEGHKVLRVAAGAQHSVIVATL
ncbi:regulator of chromosome condensation 1/beta-lactamase-inhibitor protein II [Dichotomocladium elegans]|nr:regulator of chromosome condensation 1/beta-lactamase-inhibitor protein II [Dichotomocladium elegans]